MRPAARLGDMHTCPLQTPAPVPVPHVGGPIIGPGTGTVLIGGAPAAVVGDTCVCAGGPPDSIVAGSAKVLIGGKPAARTGDTTAHGGLIAGGYPRVLIS